MAAAPRTPQRHRRSGRSKKKKKPGFSFSVTWWQGLILLVMVFALMMTAFSVRKAQISMDSLLSDRETARKEYEREVNRHQVKYREWIEYYAAVYEIDPAFVAAIIKRESDYDPHAVSYAGAMGLMQFMPDTDQTQ